MRFPTHSGKNNISYLSKAPGSSGRSSSRSSRKSSGRKKKSGGGGIDTSGDTSKTNTTQNSTLSSDSVYEYLKNKTKTKMGTTFANNYLTIQVNNGKLTQEDANSIKLRLGI